jgi:predicted Mrr-cat superfamily restriction endonuclease
MPESANYWLLSAGKDGELWPAFWNENRVAIGWSTLGDLSRFSDREELKQAVRSAWPQASSQQTVNWVAQTWRFYRGISPGDLIFVRSHGYLIGIARVEGGYEFLRQDNPMRKKFYSPYFGDDYPHVRKVSWVSLSGGMKQPLTLTRLKLVKNPTSGT